ncbi:MAG: betaine--homocysteine S-methyltransferase [Candidatus Promineifilaceae bacterium]
MMNKLQQFLAEKDTLVLDGAMGTMLFAVGLTSGDPPEEWNVSEPEKVQSVHRAYVDAGSDIILTNSFGGTSYRLKLHKLQDQVIELNRAAAQNARLVVDSAERTILVAGSMGPSGELLVPMGEMTYDQCKAAFAEQAKGLDEGGADLLWIETMSDLDEVRAAVEGARSVSDLPICATMSFDTKGRTMMGVTGKAMVESLADLGLAAIGANCGNNLPETEAALQELRAADPEQTLIIKANAGIPKWVGEDLVYDGSPEVMGAYAHRARENGAKLIGGCCGNDPRHIACMVQVLSGEIPVPNVTVKEAELAPVIKEGGRRPRRKRRKRA